jgi:hypothetical protein
MTDNLVPTLNRESRSANTRDSETRRKPWAPPSRLDAPPPLEQKSLVRKTVQT